jgi:cytokinin dehydrogenase
MIVEPECDEDVLFVLRVAAEHDVPVAVRGSGHSQSGQCLVEGAIVLDMRSMSAVRVNVEDGTVEAEGGATWRSIVDHAFADGLVPRGLTLVVDATIAGTLSVGGVGGESFRAGPQVNNVLRMDVALADGRVVRCTRHENRDVFDSVRAGLGQCGVILRAVYPLRRCKPRLRTYFFGYRKAEACVADLFELHARPRSELLLGFLSPAADKGWTILLALGKEFDRESEIGDDIRGSLRCDEELPPKDAPLWDATGIPGHVFFRMHTGAFWNDGTAPRVVHPWVDHLFTRDHAIAALDDLLSNPPAPLRMGTCGLIPVAMGDGSAPLFAVPERNGMLVGLGMFPNVPSEFREESVSIMNDYARKWCGAGGKRYLSGYVDFESERDWADHYGDAWQWFREMKTRLDPRGLLNPGFLPGPRSRPARPDRR